MNAALSEAVARTRQLDLRREAEHQRLARLAGVAKRRIGDQRARVWRGSAVVGRAAGALAVLFRSLWNRPATAAAVDAGCEPQRRRAARFEREVWPHLDRLYSLALLLTGDSGDAAELVEETVTAAYNAFQQRPGADTRAWLYGILLIAYRRGRGPEPASLAGAAAADRPPADAEPNGGLGLGPAPAEALRRLSDADVKHAVRQLPDEVRVVVYLADVEGRGYTEIADITATPTPTVTARLYHGRRQLRDRLHLYATTAVPVSR